MIRDALLIATAAHETETLRQLRSPAQDVQELGQVLAAPDIGGYRVTARVDQTAHQLAGTLHAFFADRRPDDTLVLYFSGHGIKDAAGELFLAATDTRLEDLEHTALSTDTLNRWIRACRSRRVLLILDCCYSGAFPRGMFAKAGDTVDVHERFTGRGLAIMTASTAVEYAFEGGELTDHRSDGTDTSAFTRALIHGLATGEADDNLDQRISLDELYYYVFDTVQADHPRQTPCLWLLGGQGSFIVALRRPGTTARRPRPGPPAPPIELRPDRRVLALTLPAAVAGLFLLWLGVFGLSWSPLWSIALVGLLLVLAAVPRTVRAWRGRTYLEDHGIRTTGPRRRFVPWPSVVAVEVRPGLFGRSAAARRGDRLFPMALPAPDRSWLRPPAAWRTGLAMVRDQSVRRGSPTSVVNAGFRGVLTHVVPALVAIVAVFAGADHPWTWPPVATALPDPCTLMRGSLLSAAGTPVPSPSSGDEAGCGIDVAGLAKIGLTMDLFHGRAPDAVGDARSRLEALRAEDAHSGTIDDEGGLPHDGYGVNHDDGSSTSRLRCGNVVVSASIEHAHDSGFDVNLLSTLAETAAGQLASATPGVC